MSESESIDAIEAVQPSIHSKDARRYGRTNMYIVGNVLLIWLDANIGESNSDCQNIISHLRREVNTINIFADAEERIDFLGDIEDGNRLDPSFIYTQIMKEILLTINFQQKHVDEFIQHCRKLMSDNGQQLEYVDDFAWKYRELTPIWWYTRNFYLYLMLDRALRTMDVDVMMK